MASDLIELHIMLTPEEYNKIKTLAYYSAKSKGAVVRFAIDKLNPDDFAKKND